MSTIVTVTVGDGACTPPQPTPADLLAAIESLRSYIMSTQAELAASLQALADKTDKIIAEVQASTAELQAAIAAAGNSTPAIDAAMLRLSTALQVADDLNPDVPPAP